MIDHYREDPNAKTNSNLKVRYFIIVAAFIYLPFATQAQWQEKKELCDFVQKKRWNKTTPFIGTFLDSLNYKGGDGGKQGRRRRLGELRKWLDAQSCVKTVELQGTVEAMVPQKEVLVVFDLNGNEYPMMIHIALSQPYSVAKIYQKGL